MHFLQFSDRNHDVVLVAAASVNTRTDNSGNKHTDAFQVRGKWPCQLKLESLAGNSRFLTGGSITTSFEQAAGSLLLDGTPIGSFTAAKPTCRTLISRYAICRR